MLVELKYEVCKVQNAHLFQSGGITKGLEEKAYEMRLEEQVSKRKKRKV